MDYIEDIIIVDSSEKIQYDMLNALLQSLNVKHIHYPLYDFNKPKLLNKGIQEANSKYIMATDCDYIFKSDFMKVCSEQRNENRMMHKQVKMLPNMNMSKEKIALWKFPAAGFNIWGKLANGACQYATKEYFVNNPYPEDMAGFSGMDNIMTYMAFKEGLEIHWINESEILHQYHSVVNKMHGHNRKPFDDNQKKLNDYIRDNNLPCLLHK